ncbi:MAG: TRAP transporter small permease [Proteobacteria bacterium]|nr:TRAP transporter small permease [Pseudomonadota bacterium]MBU2261944.1 TRAP transporter small permease [Pseudomonadota bacterium]
MHGQSNLLRRLNKVLLWVIFTMTAVMFMTIFLQVIFRYILALPFTFSEELARYLMVWIVCLGAAGAYGEGMHIGVAVFANLLPAGGRRWLNRIVHLTVGGLMGVIIYQGGRLSYLLADQLSPAMEIRMSWPYLAVPAGAFLILVQAAALLIRDFGGKWITPDPQEVAERCSS